MANQSQNLSGAESVGGVRIDIHGNTVPLQGALNDAEKSTKKFADTADRELGGRSRSAIGRLSEDVRSGVGNQIEAFTGLIGKVTAVIGVFTLFKSIGQALRSELESGADRAERFLNALNTRNAQSSLDQLDQQIANLEGSLANLRENSITGIRDEFDTEARVVSQLTELRKSAASIRDQINAQEVRRRELAAESVAATELKALDAVAKQAAEFAEQQIGAELEGIAKIEYERQRAAKRGQELLSQVTDEGIRREIAAALDAIETIAERRRAELADREREENRSRDERERAEIASAERQAAALQRAISSAFDSIRQQQTNGLDRLTVTVERIAQIINRIESSRR